MPENRREFLANSCLATAVSTRPVARSTPVLAAASPFNTEPPTRTYRCAVIGSTGRGGYGHGLDRVFLDLPGAELVAIADDDADGLKAAGKRTGVARLHTDYRAMLETEKIDVVRVATRQVTLHEELVIECANAGKHIFCEKPLAPDLTTADRMLQTCEEKGVKIAVAMPNRASLEIRCAFESIVLTGLTKLIRRTCLGAR